MTVLLGEVVGPAVGRRATSAGNRTAYRRGVAAEVELLRRLQQGGELAVRSAGSSGPFDLLVMADGGGRAIQCKARVREPARSEIRRWLMALPSVADGWRAQVWVRVARAGWTVYEGDGSECGGA